MLLIPVSERPDAVQILWDLLAERTPRQSISHKAMPTWEDHERFVASHPYAAWYLIDVDRVAVGAIYLTHACEIGIAVFGKYRSKGYATKAVKLLMEKHGKLRYLANVAPKNEESKALWRRLGFRHIQETYCAD